MCMRQVVLSFIIIIGNFDTTYNFNGFSSPESIRTEQRCQSQSVVVCMGAYSEKYHKLYINKTCSGLNNCSGSQVISRDRAISMGRTPCKKCRPN